MLLLRRAATAVLPAGRVSSYPIIPKNIRFKKKGKVKEKKREARRLRNVNIYDPSYTKEKIPLYMEDPSRFRIFLDAYEELRNNNRYTRKPIPEKQLKEYISRSKANSEICHYRFLKERELDIRSLRHLDKTSEIMLTLPNQELAETGQRLGPQEYLKTNYEYDVEFLYMEQIANLQPLEQGAVLRMRPIEEDAQIGEKKS